MSMSSSASGSDGAAFIRQQILASTPQTNPDAKLSDKEMQQMQKIKGGNQTSLEGDAAVSGKTNKTATEGVENAEQTLVSSGTQAEETTTASATYSTSIGEGTSVSKGIGTVSTSSIENLSSDFKVSVKEMEELIQSAIANKTSTNITDAPSLPNPKVTPRQDVLEISLALAECLASLTDSSIEALMNFMNTDKQAQQANKLSLVTSQATIEEQRAEHDKMKEIEGKQNQAKTMETVNTVCIAVSVAITVISIVAALFTCGAGLIGLAGAGAVAGAAGGTAAGTAAATATVAAGAATATAVASTTATQVTLQAVMQAVKSAIVEAIKTAIQEAVKSSVKETIKAVIKGVLKALLKVISKIFQSGKSIIQESFPKIAQAIEVVTGKALTATVGLAIAVPQLVSGLFSLDLSKAQNELADIQKNVGDLTAQSEMMKMFTMFWQQASKIAAKQTGETSEMQDQIVKTFGKMNKAYQSVSQGLASAV